MIATGLALSLCAVGLGGCCGSAPTPDQGPEPEVSADDAVDTSSPWDGLDLPVEGARVGRSYAEPERAYADIAYHFPVETDPERLLQETISRIEAQGWSLHIGPEMMENLLQSVEDLAEDVEIDPNRSTFGAAMNQGSLSLTINIIKDEREVVMKLSMVDYSNAE